MIDYDVGDEVICIDDSKQHSDGVTKRIFKGEKYKVRWIGMAFHPRVGEALCARVEGIERPLGKDAFDSDVNEDTIELISLLFPELADMPFRATRFKKVEQKKTDISVFTEMLNTTPIKEKV